jgi:hypothetical protein
MIALAAALIICMILYLIDKNQKWPATRKGAKISAAVLVCLAVVGYGCIHLIGVYQDWKLDHYLQAHEELKERVIKKFDFMRVQVANTGGVPRDTLANFCRDSDYNKLTKGEQEEVLGALNLYYTVCLELVRPAASEPTINR